MSSLTAGDLITGYSVLNANTYNFFVRYVCQVREYHNETRIGIAVAWSSHRKATAPTND